RTHTSYISHVLLLYPIFLFFFNRTALPDIYTLSLHDALPISTVCDIGCHDRAWRSGNGGETGSRWRDQRSAGNRAFAMASARTLDRKSTRLNSSHQIISYAVFCLKKKKNIQYNSSSYKQV